MLKGSHKNKPVFHPDKRRRGLCINRKEHFTSEKINPESNLLVIAASFLSNLFKHALHRTLSVPEERKK